MATGAHWHLKGIFFGDDDKFQRRDTHDLTACTQTNVVSKGKQKSSLGKEGSQLHTSCSNSLLLLLHMSEAGVPDVTPVRLLQLISYSLLQPWQADQMCLNNMRPNFAKYLTLVLINCAHEAV